VRNCITRAGHGMLTLGSETAGGIRNVEVYGIQAYGTRNGIRFKSTWPRGGVVENIRIHDIVMEDVDTVFAFGTGGRNDYVVPAPLRGTELPPYWKTITQPVEPAERGIPEYRNISFERVRATRAKVAFNVTGRSERPLRDFHFTDVHVEAEQPGAIRQAASWTMDQVVIASAAARPVTLADCERVAAPATAALAKPDAAGAGEAGQLAVVSEHKGPLIGPGYPGTQDNRSGFETGCVVWQDGIAHLLVNEMFGLPHLDLRIAHWTSRDGETWQRAATLVDSIVGRSPQNPRSEVWLNAAAFDEIENRWNIFYVGYRGGDGARGEIPGSDYEGRI
jgi:hypothetical protein